MEERIETGQLAYPQTHTTRLLVKEGAAMSMMDIIGALQRLSSKEYQTVRFLALEGMGRRDIAEAMNVGVDTVKARLQVAYQVLGVAQETSFHKNLKKKIEERQLDFYMFVFVRPAIIEGERLDLIAPYINRNPDHDYQDILSSIQLGEDLIGSNTHIAKRLRNVGAKISPEDIIDSLRKLSESEYWCVRLYVLEGMDQDDIAVKMKTSANTASRRLATACIELGVAKLSEMKIQQYELEAYFYVFVRPVVIEAEQQNLIAPYVARNPDHDYKTLHLNVSNPVASEIRMIWYTMFFIFGVCFFLLVASCAMLSYVYGWYRPS